VDFGFKKKWRGLGAEDLKPGRTKQVATKGHPQYRRESVSYYRNHLTGIFLECLSARQLENLPHADARADFMAELTARAAALTILHSLFSFDSLSMAGAMTGA
jgi:hypothetical protein